MKSIVVAILLAGALATQAQGILEYRFSGQIKSFNPGSSTLLFPGAGVGTPVTGWFTIDYNTTVHSAEIGLGGAIGTSGFNSAATPFNSVWVDEIDQEDWLLIMPAGGTAFPSSGPSINLSELTLTFYDGTGQALNGNTLPASAAEFNAFPTITLYAAADNPGTFAFYTLDVTITQVPEPSVIILAGVGLAILGLLGRGRRPSRQNP